MKLPNLKYMFKCRLEYGGCGLVFGERIHPEWFCSCNYDFDRVNDFHSPNQ